MSLTNQTRSVNVDIIRVLAMLMVIVLHTLLNFTLRPDFFATKVWWLTEFLVAFSKTAVLLLFMISGYLVIHKNRSVASNWRKTAKRILIPLIFFTGLQVLYTFWVVGGFNGVPLKQFWPVELAKLLDFPSSPPWFLVVLLFCYLLNPLWQMIFSDQQKPTVARYITSLAFAFAILTNVVQFVWPTRYILFNFFTGWMSYVSFYLYGGLIRNRWLLYQSQNLNRGLILFGLMTTIGLDFMNRLKGVNIAYANLSLPSLILALGLFNLLMTVNYQRISKQIQSLIQHLADSAFGVFMINLFVVGILSDKLHFSFDFVSMNVYLYGLLNYGLVFGISLLITIIVRRIPLVKMVIGE